MKQKIKKKTIVDLSLLKPSRKTIRTKGILEDDTDVVAIVPVGTKPFTYIGPKGNVYLSSGALSTIRHYFKTKKVFLTDWYDSNTDTYIIRSKVPNYFNNIQVPYPWIKKYRNVTIVKKEIRKITL